MISQAKRLIDERISFKGHKNSIVDVPFRLLQILLKTGHAGSMFFLAEHSEHTQTFIMNQTQLKQFSILFSNK
jgi:hypothetical protein